MWLLLLLLLLELEVGVEAGAPRQQHNKPTWGELTPALALLDTPT